MRISIYFAFFASLVAGCQQSPSSEVTTSRLLKSDLAFSDQTTTSGLSLFRHESGAVGNKWLPETLSGAVAVLDYDQDGWQDVLLTGGSHWPGEGEVINALRLYRNQQDGTFTEVTKEAGLGGIDAYPFGLYTADYDNDGDTDFYVTTLHRNLLFKNEGAVFQEVGQKSGIADYDEWSSAAVFMDADNDGWLDLYAGNYVAWKPEKDIFCSVVENVKSYCTPELYEGVPGRFYHNNGDGSFTESTQIAGFGDGTGKTLGATSLDFNNDGWPDLAVANDTQRDLLYVNQGNGVFLEEGIRSGIAFDENGKARAGMGMDAGDLKNTGDVSIVVGHFSKEMIGLYAHLNNGLFIDRAAVAKIGRPSLLNLTFSVFLFDPDLDGDLDLFATNGHLNKEIEQVEDGIQYRQKAQLFTNMGDARFSLRVPPEGDPFNQPLLGRGAAYGDFDRDGDPDLIIVENDGPVHVWRNDQTSGNELRIQLVNATGNIDGIGSRVVVKAGALRVSRYVNFGGGYLSSSEHVLTIGLGNQTVADSIHVSWPNGKIGTYSSVKAGRSWRLKQGSSQPILIQ